MIVRVRPRKKKQEGCNVEGCNGKHYAKGYCVQHYRQHQANRPITLEVKTAKKYDKTTEHYCSIEGCWGKRKTRGLCHRHYQQFLRHGHTVNTKMPPMYSTRICQHQGCEDLHLAKGYCSRHYRQFKKYGKIVRG